MSAYSPPTRRIPSCSSDYPQCEAKAYTLFPLPSHQIKTQNLSFLKRHRQIFSFRVLKRQILLPFAQKQTKTLSVFAVALHPEGVDRNVWSAPASRSLRFRSPSTRRAWIEILQSSMRGVVFAVALHPEGVDRNTEKPLFADTVCVALHPEGVDRNCSRSVPSAWSSCRPPPGGRG